MEDLAVLDLLECPLCMEPLEESAKVLPCQHTFCMACLQQHEASHPHQMCCPECRAAVPGSVQELPANPLLLRLLESLQERGPLGAPRDRSVRYISSAVQEDLLSSRFQDLPKAGQYTQGVQAQALYDFQGNAPGELTMKSGGIIHLRWRVDDNWYYGEGKDSSGLVPVDVVRVISAQPQPQPLALCRALYDFNANNLDTDDSKECLTFFKVRGRIMTQLPRLSSTSPLVVGYQLNNGSIFIFELLLKPDDMFRCAALYSYTPHHSEELELRKGEMVGVYGKFKEGWLRGLSLRTGKVGILPANYVTPVLR
uniref:SH3 domain containing ring finger 2 n=1 Tax=Sinocyclocheilus anshuiensis TaxID=1608454 RepID=A0A671MK15_9TELE